MNRGRHFYVLLLLSIFFVPLPVEGAQAGHTLTLDEALRLALARSPILEEARHQVKKAEAQVGGARAGFLPHIYLSYSYSDLNRISSSGPGDPDYLEQRDTSFSVTAVQTLFDGLTVLNQYRRAKLNLMSERERARERRLAVINGVQQAFVQLLRAKAEARSYSESVRRLEEQMKAAEMMFKKELIAYADYLSVKVNLADARQKLSQAQRAIEVARVKLKQAMGVSQSIKFRFAGRLEDFDYSSGLSLPSCVSCARENNPTLRLLNLAVEMARKDYAVAKGRFAPRVEVTAGYNIYDRDYKFMSHSMFGSFDPDQKNRYWIAGLNVRWDLFQGGARGYALQEAAAEIARLEARRREARLEIEAGIQSDFFKLKDAGERIKVARATLAQAEENYQRAQKRFFTMLGSRLELLRAQDDLVTAEVNLSRARADYLTAVSQLYYDMGMENLGMVASMVEGDGSGRKGVGRP